MPYYPPQAQQTPEKPPKKKVNFRRIVLWVSVVLILYGGIRLSLYLDEMNRSRLTKAKLDAIVAEVEETQKAESPTAAPETTESVEAEALAEVYPETPASEADTKADEETPAVEAVAEEKAKNAISDTLPLVQYPDGYKANEKVAKLQRESANIVGYLQIDDPDPKKTLKEAVAKKDNTYYLNHDALGNRNANGAVFLDQDISLETRPYTILLYGHNMKTGEKFGNLWRYEDFSYFMQHRIFQLDMTYDSAKYAIFAVTNIRLTPGRDHYVNLQALQSLDRETRRKALDSLIKYSKHQNTLDVNEEDQVVLLITCVGNDDERLVIAGRRLRDGEREDYLEMKKSGGR